MASSDVWRPIVCFEQFAVEVVRGPKLQKMSAEISKSISMTALSSFAPVIEFLQGAGQSQLVSQVAGLIYCWYTGWNMLPQLYFVNPLRDLQPVELLV